jgi:hypothetical protein
MMMMVMVLVMMMIIIIIIIMIMIMMIIGLTHTPTTSGFVLGCLCFGTLLRTVTSYDQLIDFPPQAMLWSHGPGYGWASSTKEFTLW